MKIIYNVPVQVSQEQFNYLENVAGGYLAFAKEGCWVKLMLPTMGKHVEGLLAGFDAVNQ